jgi:GAF domain-containing protein
VSAAPTSEREQERLEALRSYAILDSDPERSFDDITRLAVALCGVPIAAISLVDEHRQWFKSRVGLDAEQTPREQAFCAQTIRSERLLVVEDAREDSRFCDNPLVTGEPRIRFYAGAPLTVEGGLRLGTLCAIDRQPRRLSPEQLAGLEALARQIVELLELRRVSARLAAALEKVQTLAELIPICAHCRQVRDDKNYWSSLERFVAAHTGSRFTHGICPSCVHEHFPELADEVDLHG